MEQNLTRIFTLFGGLALFLYGMDALSHSLETAAGSRLKSLLAAVTGSPVRGVLAGAAVTAVLQSSSAVTVMVLGFVSAGLLTLRQAVPVIFGCNIGTTVTAQLLAFRLEDVRGLVLLAGLLLCFACAGRKARAIGRAVFAFGLLFEGIADMGTAMEPLAQSPVIVHWLGRVRQHPWLGLLAGLGMTLTVQSSSATIALLQNFAARPGLDGSSLLGLAGALPVLLGDNIGTTITAQIIAFKLSDYVLGIVLVGFLVMQLAKQGQMKYVGTAVFGFGLLFLGIDTMGAVMKPLAENPVFTDMIAQVTGVPVLGVLVGTLMTLVVQSSSATIAVLQNFAATPGVDGASIIGLEGAIPILLGDNLGTTITALLAAIGQSRDAKRVALSHCIFNLSGCLLFVWLIGPAAAVVAAISPAGPEVEVIARQIANAHTLFNVTMTVLWLPLVSVMVKIVMAILPEKPRRPRDSLADTLETPLAPDAAAA